MAIGKNKKHQFEHCGPAQERFPIAGLPGMEGTAKPIDHPNVTTHPAARPALEENERTTGYNGEVCYSEKDSQFKIKGHGPGLQSPKNLSATPGGKK